MNDSNHLECLNRLLKNYRLLIPLVVFLSLSLLLWKGLSLKPMELPSVLMGPAPPSSSVNSVEDPILSIQEKDQRKEPQKEKTTAKDLYPFKDLTEQIKFTKLIEGLRCSVCQNQTLADSKAPLAVDLRHEIYQKVLSQESEKEIIEFVSSRYGAFVLYRPPLQWGTVVLWFGPLLFLAIGFGILRGVFTKT